jgi:hypothetical protein
MAYLARLSLQLATGWGLEPEQVVVVHCVVVLLASVFFLLFFSGWGWGLAWLLSA